MTVAPDLSAEGMPVAAPPGASPAPVRIGRLGGDRTPWSCPAPGPPPARRPWSDTAGPLGSRSAAHDGAASGPCSGTVGSTAGAAADSPSARKVGTALLAPGRPVLIVNASESEPASRKDRTLCRYRPHLVLDGAALLARALGVDEVVAPPPPERRVPVRPAVAGRRRPGAGRGARPRLAPVRGSRPLRRPASRRPSPRSSTGGEARPRFTTAPLAVVGPSGRPTVVTNAETVAQLAVAARIGAVAWNALGAPSLARPPPGHRGRCRAPSGRRPRADRPGHHRRPPGRRRAHGGPGRPCWWADSPGPGCGATRRGRPRSTGSPSTASGASPGCGLLGVLPHDACPLRRDRPDRPLPGRRVGGQCGPAWPDCPGWPTAWRPWPAARPAGVPWAGWPRWPTPSWAVARAPIPTASSGSCTPRSTSSTTTSSATWRVARAGARTTPRSWPSPTPGRRRPRSVRRGGDGHGPHRPHPLPRTRHLRAVLRRRRGARPVGIRPGGRRRRRLGPPVRRARRAAAACPNGAFVVRARHTRSPRSGRRRRLVAGTRRARRRPTTRPGGRWPPRGPGVPARWTGGTAAAAPRRPCDRSPSEPTAHHLPSSRGVPVGKLVGVVALFVVRRARRGRAGLGRGPWAGTPPVRGGIRGRRRRSGGGRAPALPAGWAALEQAAAATCPGLSWSVLAAIGTVESDSGRSTAPGVPSGANPAGAEGPFQFEPATFAAYATVGPGGARPASPYDPVDAVYTAAAAAVRRRRRHGRRPARGRLRLQPRRRPTWPRC